MPYEKDDKPDSLDRVRGDRSLARCSGFMARRDRKLAEKARELKLADEIEVVFPDKGLEDAVRRERYVVDDKIPYDGPLTRGHLKRMKELEAYDEAIEDLTGLEHAVNLTFVGLWRNQTCDVSPLASLTKLTALYLDRNESNDVSPLASLTNLTALGIHEGPSDITPLASLTKLTELSFDFTYRIGDISPLASLTNLARLDLGYNLLSQESIDTHIPNLESRGVSVLSPPNQVRTNSIEGGWMYQVEMYRRVRRAWREHSGSLQV